MTGSSSSGGGGGGGAGGGKDPYAVMTPPTVVKGTSAAPNWGNLRLTLDLPRGSARPPLLAIGLWSGDPRSEHEGLAVEDVRLSLRADDLGFIGIQDVQLVPRKGFGCKQASMSFAARILTM